MQKQSLPEEYIGDDKLLLLDFYAAWCGPCEAMNPILQEVGEELEEKVEIVKIDVDTHPNLAKEYDISGLPTLIIVQEGEIVWRYSGMLSAYHLENIINV